MTRWPSDQMTIMARSPDHQRTIWPDDQMTRWPDGQMTILTRWTDDRMTTLTKLPDDQIDQMTIVTKGPYDHIDQMTRWWDDQMTILTRWPYRPDDHMTILTRWTIDKKTRWPYWPDYHPRNIIKDNSNPSPPKSVTTAPKIGTSSLLPESTMIYDDLTILMYTTPP